MHRPHTESAARKVSLTCDALLLLHSGLFTVHFQAINELAFLQSFLGVKFKSRKNAHLLEGSLFEHIERMWAAHEAQISAGKFKV